MPIVKSITKKALQDNTKELIASGRDTKQAYAIAKDVQRRAMNKPNASSA
ncbi:hypothetical protein CPT_Premi_053 [Proteus phage Premi]|uniref:Uncharacterized protein n=1 Tax=Proteus phage Premi TaxID=3097470 RepID=A0ABZ0ZXX3_9CAUD|nr:hypothetical protein CPT_Premi_053 [Proteus phage Premi]